MERGQSYSVSVPPTNLFDCEERYSAWHRNPNEGLSQPPVRSDRIYREARPVFLGPRLYSKFSITYHLEGFLFRILLRNRLFPTSSSFDLSSSLCGWTEVCCRCGGATEKIHPLSTENRPRGAHTNTHALHVEKQWVCFAPDRGS